MANELNVSGHIFRVLLLTYANSRSEYLANEFRMLGHHGINPDILICRNISKIVMLTFPFLGKLPLPLLVF